MCGGLNQKPKKPKTKNKMVHHEFCVVFKKKALSSSSHALPGYIFTVHHLLGSFCGVFCGTML